MTGAHYALLLRSGRVLDPAAGLDAVRDVALAGGRVAAVAARLELSPAARVFDATGLLVTPGLVDIHTHIYDAGGALSVPVDEHCLPNGVTTAVSARGMQVPRHSATS